MSSTTVHVRPIRSPDEREACFDIRREVFIVEQSVPEPEEWDEHDDDAVHYLALPDEGSPAADALGTARLRFTVDQEAKVERVAVRQSARGRGIGVALMLALEEEGRGRGCQDAILSAQVQALPFYERQGYAAYGPVYDDAGIPHRMMRKHLTKGKNAG